MCTSVAPKATLFKDGVWLILNQLRFLTKILWYEYLQIEGRLAEEGVLPQILTFQLLFWGLALLCSAVTVGFVSFKLLVHHFLGLLSSQRTCNQSRTRHQSKLPYISHQDPWETCNECCNDQFRLCDLRYPKVVHIRESFLQKTSPLFRDPPNFMGLIRSHNL